MAEKDNFPSTHKSLFERNLQRGGEGLAVLNRHIMEIYAEPLRIYFSGCRDRWLGSPDEIVNQFFEDRLSRPDFLLKWQDSPKLLRHWLINAFQYFLKETKKRRVRDRIVPLPPEVSEPLPGVEADFEKGYVQSVVLKAMERAEEMCLVAGQSEHWTVFHRHHYDGSSYLEIEEEMQVEATRAAVMVRTVREKFLKAIREVLQFEGVRPEKIDEEIRELLAGETDRR